MQVPDYALRAAGPHFDQLQVVCEQVVDLLLRLLLDILVDAQNSGLPVPQQVLSDDLPILLALHLVVVDPRLLLPLPQLQGAAGQALLLPGLIQEEIVVLLWGEALLLLDAGGVPVFREEYSVSGALIWMPEEEIVAHLHEHQGLRGAADAQGLAGQVEEAIDAHLDLVVLHLQHQDGEEGSLGVMDHTVHQICKQVGLNYAFLASFASRLALLLMLQVLLQHLPPHVPISMVRADAVTPHPDLLLPQRPIVQLPVFLHQQHLLFTVQQMRPHSLVPIFLLDQAPSSLLHPQLTPAADSPESEQVQFPLPIDHHQMLGCTAVEDLVVVDLMFKPDGLVRVGLQGVNEMEFVLGVAEHQVFNGGLSGPFCWESDLFYMLIEVDIGRQAPRQETVPQGLVSALC